LGTPVADYATDDFQFEVFDQQGCLHLQTVTLPMDVYNTELIAEELYIFPKQTIEHPVNPSLCGNRVLQVPDKTIRRIKATMQYVRSG